MITVGTDTYITVSQAQALIEKVFLTDDESRVAFETLSDDDKEIYLYRACMAIESVAFIGKKVDPDQTLSFPRITMDDEQDDVPDAVKFAQALEAVELISPTTDTSEFNARSGNVKSYTATGLSETFMGTNASKKALFGCIRCKQAQALLLAYIGGGFDVC